MNSGGFDKALANTEHTEHCMLPSCVFLRAKTALSSRKYPMLGTRRCCFNMWDLCTCPHQAKNVREVKSLDTCPVGHVPSISEDEKASYHGRSVVLDS